MRRNIKYRYPYTLKLMKKNSAILGMIFGAGIGIIFNSTGLGLPLGAGVGYLVGLILSQEQNKKEKQR
jgi:uncharacterized membrane protein